VFTDPVVISGPVTNDERAQRSSIGVFLFVPPGVNEGLIGEVGLRLVQEEDVPANAALVSGRWHRARQEHELLKLEGLQRFFAYVEPAPTHTKANTCTQRKTRGCQSLGD
jgi:hypothetical protein